jgi:hypothetical protein
MGTFSHPVERALLPVVLRNSTGTSARLASPLRFVEQAPVPKARLFQSEPRQLYETRF